MAHLVTVAVANAKQPEIAALRSTSRAVEGTSILICCNMPACTPPTALNFSILNNKSVNATACNAITSDRWLETQVLLTVLTAC